MDIGKLEKQLKTQVDARNKILVLIKQYKDIHSEKMKHIGNESITNYGNDDAVLLKHRKALRNIKKQILNRCFDIVCL